MLFKCKLTIYKITNNLLILLYSQFQEIQVEVKQELEFGTFMASQHLMLSKKKDRKVTSMLSYATPSNVYTVYPLNHLTCLTF